MRLARIRLLLEELSHARPLRSPYANYSDETARELAIADRAQFLKAHFGQGAVANYVISKSATPSDLLETAILMKEAGLFLPGSAPKAGLRIVPLFETIDDLRRFHRGDERLFRPASGTRHDRGAGQSSGK